jgi:hypothetical protein
MSAAPFAGLTKPQKRALADVAFGGDGTGFSPRTLVVLRDRGLIESYDRRVGRDRFGEIVVKAWTMPIPVHIEFCAWVVEQPEADFFEEAA